MIPTSRQQFKDKCLRALGMPVLPVEIDEDQIDDAVDNALQMYQEYHYDGTEPLLYKYKITQNDIDREYIDIPENIIGISTIMSFSSSMVSNPPFGAKYQMMLNDFFNLSSANIVPYNNAMSYLSMISEFFNSKPNIRYNRHVNKLYLELDWKADLYVGMWIIIKAVGIIDPNVYTDIWGDRWLLRYATELMKKQVGTHLKKFNITLIGGVSYNGSEMYMDAVREIEKLENEMISTYSIPTAFYVE